MHTFLYPQSLSVVIRRAHRAAIRATGGHLSLIPRFAPCSGQHHPARCAPVARCVVAG